LTTSILLVLWNTLIQCLYRAIGYFKHNQVTNNSFVSLGLATGVETDL
jgi:hypothetical protein